MYVEGGGCSLYEDTCPGICLEGLEKNMENSFIMPGNPAEYKHTVLPLHQIACFGLRYVVPCKRLIAGVPELKVRKVSFGTNDTSVESNPAKSNRL
jgi:hypothetical protein